MLKVREGGRVVPVHALVATPAAGPGSWSLRCCTLAPLVAAIGGAPRRCLAMLQPNDAVNPMTTTPSASGRVMGAAARGL